MPSITYREFKDSFTHTDWQRIEPLLPETLSNPERMQKISEIMKSCIVFFPEEDFSALLQAFNAHKNNPGGFYTILNQISSGEISTIPMSYLGLTEADLPTDVRWRMDRNSIFFKKFEALAHRHFLSFKQYDVVNRNGERVFSFERDPSFKCPPCLAVVKAISSMLPVLALGIAFYHAYTHLAGDNS